MADKPHKRPRSKSHRIWQSLLYVALVLFAFSIYQLYSHYSADGAKAMEEGKRIVISLPDGTIESRPIKPDEKPPEEKADEKTGEHPEDKAVDEKVEEKVPDKVEPEDRPADAKPDAEKKDATPSEEKKPQADTDKPVEDKSGDKKPAKEDDKAVPKNGHGKEVAPAKEGTPNGDKVPVPDAKGGESVEAPKTEPDKSGTAKAGNGKADTAKADTAKTKTDLASPADAIKGNRVAIIITGLGLSKATTEEAITLPANVTLAFSAYANSLQEWVQRAKGLGYSILLEVPMETADYPITDPGPLALLSKSTSGQNIDQLYTVLTQAQGYEGLIAAQNENFTFTRNLFEPVLSKIKDERLFFVYQQRPGNFQVADLAGTLKADTIPYTIVLDEDITEEAIEKKLNELESVANQKGYAIAVGRPYPLTVNAVRAWMEGAGKRGITVVPAKNLISK